MATQEYQTHKNWILTAIVFLFLFGTWESSDACELPYVMKFAPDLHTQSVDKLLLELSQTPVNVISTTISWDVVEPEPDNVSLAPYITKLTRLVEAGYCLNIIIDTSGRWKLDINGIPQQGGSIPSWLASTLGHDPYAYDFFGKSSRSMLSVSDRKGLLRVKLFYRNILTLLKSSLGDNIVFVTIGAAPELEAKYSQNSYAYQDYSVHSEAAYAAFRDALGLMKANQPMLDYAQHFLGGAPRAHDGRDTWMQFRRTMLAHYFCSLSREIRALGFEAFAYFGGPFQSHDAIYATNAIDGMTKCFDGIAIDHNFYNGYETDKDGSYVGTILSYAVNAGFDRIVIGLYAERLVIDGFTNSEIEKTFADALDMVVPDRAIIGLEIGGLRADIPGQLSAVYTPDLMARLAHIRLPALDSDRLPIALVANSTTFELWQGDNGYGRAVHQDALRQTFRRLNAVKELEVHVVSEAVLARNVASYAGIFLPHVTAPSDKLLETVQLATSAGIGVIQDVRFGEFKPDGDKRDDSARRLFGIKDSSWREHEITVMWRGAVQINLRRAPNSYATGFIMSGRTGYTIEAPLHGEERAGLMLRGDDTLCLGFLLGDADTTLGALASDAIVTFLKDR